MDTQIIEKMQLAGMKIDILNDSMRKQRSFSHACIQQLNSVENELANDLGKYQGETNLDQYQHIANMVDNCANTISNQTYDEEH